MFKKLFESKRKTSNTESASISRREPDIEAANLQVGFIILGDQK